MSLEQRKKPESADRNRTYDLPHTGRMLLCQARLYAKFMYDMRPVYC